MEKQKNVNASDLSLNFNLREPKGNKCTNVYAVLKCGSIVYKFPIDCKVNSWQWSKKQQAPTVADNMTNEDRKNNLRVLSVISAIKYDYMNYFSYLCSAENEITANEVREYFKETIETIISNNDDMANERNLSRNGKPCKVSTLLNKAFSIYYKEIKPLTKESSKKQELSKLNAFIMYCEEIGKDSINVLSQRGINDYKSYLIKKGDSPKQINNKCTTIVKLINKVLICHSDFNKYNSKLNAVVYTKLQEIKQEGELKKRRPLTDEEINKLMTVELTDEEKEYRDLFILECNGSYRVSDTHKLFDKDLHKIYERNGYKLIYFSTQKKEIDACIFVNKTVENIQNKYKDGFKYADLNSRSFADRYNVMLKRITKKAELNTIETYKDAHGVIHKQPLHKIIASHFARYTFIYNALFKMGLTPQETANFTGHKDDKMITEVYNIYKDQLKVNESFAALERVGIIESEKKVESNSNESQLFEKGKEEKEKELIEEYKKVLCYLGANYMEISDINDIDKLFVMTYVDFQSKFDAIGIDVHRLKEIYNTPNTTLKEKREMLENLIEEVLTKELN